MKPNLFQDRQGHLLRRPWVHRKGRRAPSFPKAPFIFSMAISRILSGQFLSQDDHLSLPDFSGSPMSFGCRKPPLQHRDATIPEDLYRAGCPSSVLSCTAWGFSCLANYFASGELLPRLFTLTCPKERTVVLSKNRRCLFCDTFRQRPLSRMLPAYFTRHAAVWCSDFPPASLATYQRSSAIDA